MSFNELLSATAKFFITIANSEKKIEIVKQLFIEFKDFDPYLLYLYISKSKDNIFIQVFTIHLS
jgi:hypothetical protein